MAMSLLINLTSISSLRRMALGALIILEINHKEDFGLYSESLEQAKKLIKVLRELETTLDEYDYVALLEEPWDKIIIEIAEKWCINRGNKEEIKKHIKKMIKYLEKLVKGEKLTPYEKRELRKLLFLLVDIPLAEEHKLLSTLRRW